MSLRVGAGVVAVLLVVEVLLFGSSPNPTSEFQSRVSSSPRTHPAVQCTRAHAQV